MNDCVSTMASASENSPCPLSHPACCLEGPKPSERQTQRLQTLDQLNLRDSASAATFEEATQMACQFLGASVGILSVVDDQHELFKGANGLAQFGLMNPLSQSRRLELTDSFAHYILDSNRALLIPDVTDYPALQASLLVQYGVRAYAGVPLVTSTGVYIGALAIMDFQPRHFTAQEKAFLELAARWSMSEYEREQLQTSAANADAAIASTAVSTQQCLMDSLRLSLISDLTEELRSPLTSVLGMTTMLSREIYGPLTLKQREYTNIVRTSSEALMEIADEMAEIEALGESCQQLNLISVDIEMLSQQVIKNLEPVAYKQEQALQLTIEPGPRIYRLDKIKVKQLLHYLVLSVIQLSGSDNTVRLHISHRPDHLSLCVWLSNCWLGDGLPQQVLQLYRTLEPGSAPARAAHVQLAPPQHTDLPPSPHSRELLGLLLSSQLAALHGGSLGLKGSLDAGYRFEIQLPLSQRGA